MDNSGQETYYKNLFERIIRNAPEHLNENDINSMLQLLKSSPLPHIIRINKKSQYFEYIKKYFMSKELLHHISDNIYEVKDGLRKIDRKMLKTQDNSNSAKEDDINTSDRFFFNTLVDLGFVTNQEIVSMIPSSFIISIAQKHDKSDFYLDLCAAPGSKSSHIIENNINLITNEVVRSRAHILNSRLGDHSEKFVICSDGRKIPIVKRTLEDSTSHVFKFNSVLADVPCSGDGTFRKNFLGEFDSNKKQANHDQYKTPRSNILGESAAQDFVPEVTKDHTALAPPTSKKTKAFTIQGFLKNPFLNIQLVERALHLANNYVIYSTCSLDPIENEYVISKIDCEIVKWTDIGNTIFEFANHKDQIEAKNSSKHHLIYRPGLVEYENGYICFKNENLIRTMRFYPHDNNSGGFFVAILKKKGVKKNQSETLTNNLLRTIKITSNLVLRINNTVFRQVSHQIYENLIYFYKLKLPKEYIFLSTDKTENKIILFHSLGVYSLAKVTNCISFGNTVFEKDRKNEDKGTPPYGYKITNLFALQPFITEYIQIEDVNLFEKILNGSVSRNEIQGERNQKLLTEWNGAIGIFSFSCLFFKGYIGNKITFHINKREREVIEKTVLDIHR